MENKEQFVWVKRTEIEKRKIVMRYDQVISEYFIQLDRIEDKLDYLFEFMKNKDEK